MADLSNVKRSQTDPHILYLNKAVDKVANLVSANIKDLYTHHPALVVWVFSSNRIPCNVQNKVVSCYSSEITKHFFILNCLKLFY